MQGQLHIALGTFDINLAGADVYIHSGGESDRTFCYTRHLQSLPSSHVGDNFATVPGGTGGAIGYTNPSSPGSNGSGPSTYEDTDDNDERDDTQQHQLTKT
jgi:hypothetical protein